MSTRARRWLAAATAALVLLAVNLQIRSSEDLLAHGRSFYLQLAPVDPRSLMQGDYMVLNFELANQLQQQLSPHDQSGQAVIRLDSRGVGQTIRVLQSDWQPEQEVLLNFRRSGWRVYMGSDAYFFEEGQGERFERARFGHFRADGKGRALLVELCDEALQPL